MWLICFLLIIQYTGILGLNVMHGYSVSRHDQLRKLLKAVYVPRETLD